MKKHILFLLILVISSNMPAQYHRGFDLSLIGESPEPELFYGDPHYDTSGNIQYYSLSDYARVYYTYDEKGNVLQRDTYVLNNFHYDWVLRESVVSSYEHGRLKKECTSYRPGWDYNRLKKPEIREAMVRKFDYDDKNKIETITIITDQRQKQRKSSVEKDTTTIIRYLNEEGLPYKSFTRRKWFSYYADCVDEAYSMQLYAYDTNSQLIKMEKYYHRIHKPEWTLSNITQIEYNDNRTIYMFSDALVRSTVAITAKDPFGLQQKYKQYLKKQEEEERLRKQSGEGSITISIADVGRKEVEPAPVYTLRHTLSFDDKRRITARDVSINSTTFITSRYTFDDMGRTSVTCEEVIADSYLRKDPYSTDYLVEYDMRKIDAPVKRRYKASYSGENCQDFTFWRRVESQEELQIDKEVRHCYLADRLFSSVALSDFTERGFIYNQERGEFNYSEDMLSGEYTEFRIVDEKDRSSGTAKTVKKEYPSYKISFRMDKQYNRTDDLKSDYNIDTNSWEPSTREED